MSFVCAIKDNTPAVSSKASTAATATEAAEAAASTMEDGPTITSEDYSNVAVTRDLVSHAEEEDMEALLDAYAFIFIVDFFFCKY